jgi:hypothetical protein
MTPNENSVTDFLDFKLNVERNLLSLEVSPFEIMEIFDKAIEIEKVQKDVKIDLAIAEFERLKSKAESIRDLLYLNGVLTVLETIKNETFNHEQN